MRKTPWTRKPWFAGVAAILTTLVVTVLAAVAPQTASAQQTVTVFIGTTPDYANIYVARDEGFFEAEGLKLDIRPFPSGRTATDGFRSRKVELIAAGYMPAMRICEVNPVRHFAHVRAVCLRY